jgi:hypothetical protein
LKVSNPITVRMAGFAGGDPPSNFALSTAALYRWPCLCSAQ